MLALLGTSQSTFETFFVTEMEEICRISFRALRIFIFCATIEFFSGELTLNRYPTSRRVNVPSELLPSLWLEESR